MSKNTINYADRKWILLTGSEQFFMKKQAMNQLVFGKSPVFYEKPDRGRSNLVTLSGTIISTF